MSGDYDSSLSWKIHASFPFRFSFFPPASRSRASDRCGLLEHGGIEGKRIEADPHTGDLIKCRNFRRRQRKERKTFRFAARRRARDLTCRCAESRWKVENPYDPPSKVFARSPEMDSFETPCRSPRTSPGRFPPLRSVFRAARFYFPAARLLSGARFIGCHSDASCLLFASIIS